MSQTLIESRAALTPPLKWAGGKRWSLPVLRPLWTPHAHRRLVEPFAGGLAVTLGLMPERALINDVNPHLMNFYQWVKQGLSNLRIPSLLMHNDEEVYYHHRDLFNRLIAKGPNGREQALLFYYLNRTGFNGLCRFNRRGGFNVPMGRYRSITYRQDFHEYESAFANWSIHVGDFAQVPIRPEDFIYADPPYDVEFTTYAAGGFSWEDQTRTATWLAAHPGPVILVNQATPRIEALYRALRYDIRYLDARRSINSNGQGRHTVREIFATRNI